VRRPPAAVLAVDGGNSKADVAIVARDGRLLAAVRGPTISHQQVGLREGVARLRALVDEAARRAGMPALGDTAVAELGMYCVAGADFRREVSVLTTAFAESGLTQRTEVLNDTLAPLRAGTERGWGVVLICGAGVNAAGVGPGGRTARLAALGPISGDEGGGRDLGMGALGAAVRARDGRGPRTTLERLVPAHFHLARPAAVTRAMYDGRIDEDRVRELSPVVFAAAQAGDAVARAHVGHGSHQVDRAVPAGETAQRPRRPRAHHLEARPGQRPPQERQHPGREPEDRVRVGEVAEVPGEDDASRLAARAPEGEVLEVHAVRHHRHVGRRAEGVPVRGRADHGLIRLGTDPRLVRPQAARLETRQPAARRPVARGAALHAHRQRVHEVHHARPRGAGREVGGHARELHVRDVVLPVRGQAAQRLRHRGVVVEGRLQGQGREAVPQEVPAHGRPPQGHADDAIAVRRERLPLPVLGSALLAEGDERDPVPGTQQPELVERPELVAPQQRVGETPGDE